jgi:outer membrane protein assembly factor BamA
VTIEGNRRTRDRIIRRYIKIAATESDTIMDAIKELDVAVGQLRELDIFKSVDVYVKEHSDGSNGEDLDVVITVSEKGMWKLDISTQYGMLEETAEVAVACRNGCGLGEVTRLHGTYGRKSGLNSQIELLLPFTLTHRSRSTASASSASPIVASPALRHYLQGYWAELILFSRQFNYLDCSGFVDEQRGGSLALKSSASPLSYHVQLSAHKLGQCTSPNVELQKHCAGIYAQRVGIQWQGASLIAKSTLVLHHGSEEAVQPLVELQVEKTARSVLFPSHRTLQCEASLRLAAGYLCPLPSLREGANNTHSSGNAVHLLDRFHLGGSAQCWGSPYRSLGPRSMGHDENHGSTAFGLCRATLRWPIPWGDTGISLFASTDFGWVQGVRRSGSEHIVGEGSGNGPSRSIPSSWASMRALVQQHCLQSSAVGISLPIVSGMHAHVSYSPASWMRMGGQPHQNWQIGIGASFFSS